MFSLRQPTAETIQTFLAAQSRLNFTYSAIGATATTPPSGFVVDHTRIRLGQGEKTFAAAQAGLERWEQFRLGWVQACPSTTPIHEGQAVAVLARIFGLWCLNACRIVYVVNEAGPIKRFGFAYGTLPEHLESGEERFTVEWHQDDDAVWYDILAFSRPRHFLARLGYPYGRRLQKRFARDSTAAMVRAIARSVNDSAPQESP